MISYINPTYIEEANILKSLESQLAILFEHMLKWQYHSILQSKSWMNSILDSYNEIVNIDKKYWRNININDCYIKGRKKAISLEGSKFDNIYPKEIPLDWNYNTITNKYFIADYLRKYYNHNILYKFDLNGKIYEKLGL